jgi:uncharacterized protein (DUF983 family)
MAQRALGSAPAPVLPFGYPSVRELALRALRLRCPRCGLTPLYRSRFTMEERCRACALRFEAEQGYFVGAIYLNYAATVAVALGGVLLIDTAVGLTLTQQLVLGIAVGLLAPPLFFRHARSVWLAFGYLVALTDERWERSRRQSG